MTDCFALLNEPRRPWIDPDELKTKYLELSSYLHPDRFAAAVESEKIAANQRYTELNTAYQCLREPKERLWHLLQLERGEKPKDIQRIPPDTADFFMEIGQVFRQTDLLLAEKSKAVSPLARVTLFKRGLEWLEQLKTLQTRVAQKENEVMDELKTLNGFWIASPTGTSTAPRVRPLDRVEQIYRTLSYLRRWQDQIRERLVQLSG